MEGLEPEHGPRDPFDEAMILFRDIVEIFDLQDLCDPSGPRELQGHVDAFQARQVGATLVDDTLSGVPFAPMARFRKRLAAAASRRSDNMKSRVLPS